MDYCEKNGTHGPPWASPAGTSKHASSALLGMGHVSAAGIACSVSTVLMRPCFYSKS